MQQHVMVANLKEIKDIVEHVSPLFMMHIAFSNSDKALLPELGDISQLFNVDITKYTKTDQRGQFNEKPKEVIKEEIDVLKNYSGRRLTMRN